MSEMLSAIRESGFFEKIIAENRTQFRRFYIPRFASSKNGMPVAGYPIPAGVVRSMTVVPVTLPGEQEPRDANRAEDGF